MCPIVLGQRRDRLRHAKRPYATEKAIDDFFRGGDLLAAFKRPRRVVFVAALPTNPSGKVLTRELIANLD